MKLIAEITNADIAERLAINPSYTVRKAVRAVVTNENGEIGITFSPVTKLYKLPGGGIEVGEDHDVALKRELREETGYDSQIDIANPIGCTIEYRENEGNLSISYVYNAKLVGTQQALEMTAQEQDRQTEFKWLNPQLIIAELSQTKFSDYAPKFISLREMRILTEVLADAHK